MINPLISHLKKHYPITPGEQAIIEPYFVSQTYKEGEVLFKGDRICTDMFFITQGVLKIVITNEKGVDVTHYFSRENQFCTILYSFNNKTIATEGIVAACDAEVLAVKYNKLMELYQKLPYMKELIDNITHQRLMEKIQIRNSYQGVDSANRYRMFMTQQADVALRIPLKDIASYLEITPQSLSRIRKNIK